MGNGSADAGSGHAIGFPCKRLHCMFRFPSSSPSTTRVTGRKASCANSRLRMRKPTLYGNVTGFLLGHQPIVVQNLKTSPPKASATKP